ncbi:hypothetical protein WMF28_01915 [Sorangium sp. So ce590]|uniref:hypothetical protein n=1 Tax=Sorangium sp. So ce590 TaxID=3133317 RepID=UPI003F62E8C3
MSSKRPITMVLDAALEDRVNTRRVIGKKIRSFSDVAREALAKGLDVLEQDRPAAPHQEAT